MTPDVQKRIKVGRFRLKYEHRSPAARMGRFGGGWQWEVGIQAGNLTRKHGHIIINLLVSSVHISWSGIR